MHREAVGALLLEWYNKRLLEVTGSVHALARTTVRSD